MPPAEILLDHFKIRVKIYELGINKSDENRQFKTIYYLRLFSWTGESRSAGFHYGSILKGPL